MSLVTFPNEINYQFFSHLGLKDLLKCAEVSKTWRRIASDDTLWRKFLPPKVTLKADIKNYILTHLVKSKKDTLNFKNGNSSILFSLNTNLEFNKMGIRRGWLRNSVIWMRTFENPNTNELKVIKIKTMENRLANRVQIPIILSIYLLCFYILKTYINERYGL